MRYDLDPELDYLYVYLRKETRKGEAATTRKLCPGVYGDFDRHKYLIGIEIVNTRRALGTTAKDLED